MLSVITNISQGDGSRAAGFIYNVAFHQVNEIFIYIYVQFASDNMIY
jgi:hypothetical protein